MKYPFPGLPATGVRARIMTGLHAGEEGLVRTYCVFPIEDVLDTWAVVELDKTGLPDPQRIAVRLSDIALLAQEKP